MIAASPDHRVSPAKKVLFVFFAILLVVITTLFHGCWKEKQAQSLSIGIVKGDLSALLLQCALQQQYFKSEGIQSLQLKRFQSEKELVTALKTGLIDGGALNCDHFFRWLREDSFPCSIISPLSVHGYLLLVEKESRYRELDSYEKLNIAVTHNPGLECYLIEKLLQENSIPLSRLNFVVTSHEKMGPLLLEHSVDFAMVGEPEASKLLANDAFHVFIHSAKIWFHHPNTLLVFSGETFNNRRFLTFPTLFALFETSDWMAREKHRFPDLALELVQMNNSTLERVYYHYLFSAKFGLNGLDDFFHYMNPDISFDDYFQQSAYLTAQAQYISRKEAYYSSLKKKTDK